MNKWLISILAIAFQSCLPSQGEKNFKSEQLQPVGGPCEGCEAIFETPVPFLKLPPVDTLPDYYNASSKLVVSGIVYGPDGKTPAPDVVVYMYHTNEKGVYPKKGNEKGWALRHGFIRGWIKTGSNGTYKFVTAVPAAYPNRKDPAHIHITVKEPNKNEYYIDEILFENDPLLTEAERNKILNRAGSGLVQLTKNKGIFYCKRDIYLGKNIPNYPQK